MDRLINSFSEKTPAQKIIITILGTIIFFLVLGASYLLTTPPSTKKSFQDQNNTGDKNISTPTLVPINTQPTNMPWVSYQGKNYKMSYPPDLISKPGVISTGGTSLFLSGKSSDFTNYNIDIQITSSSVIPIENVSNIFRGLGFQESNTIVDNTKAYKFSGHIGDGLSALQETAIIFEDRGRLYKIQLSYQKSQPDFQIQQIFQKILTAFKLI